MGFYNGARLEEYWREEHGIQDKISKLTKFAETNRNPIYSKKQIYKIVDRFMEKETHIYNTKATINRLDEMIAKSEQNMHENRQKLENHHGKK